MEHDDAPCSFRSLDVLDETENEIDSESEWENDLQWSSAKKPHSSIVPHPTWLEQTALYSLVLELQIGMQTVRKVPNTRKRHTVKRSVYSHRFQSSKGSPRHPKRDVTCLINIPYIRLCRTRLHSPNVVAFSNFQIFPNVAFDLQ